MRSGGLRVRRNSKWTPKTGHQFKLAPNERGKERWAKRSARATRRRSRRRWAWRRSAVSRRSTRSGRRTGCIRRRSGSGSARSSGSRDAVRYQARGPKKADGPGDTEQLYNKIGRLEGRAGLAEKKVRAEPVTCAALVDRARRGAGRAVSRQCALAGVSRSWVYAQRDEGVLDEDELTLLRLIDAQYTRRPFYGTRRMVRLLGVSKGTTSTASGCSG
jgi:hypothetical protein